ncbi:MAG: hypothetical protein WBS24_17215 [Terriglobales bacterium]
MKRAVAILAALLLLSPIAAVAQFEHPDIKSGKKHVHSLLCMPVQVELTRVGMKGSESMLQESLETEQALTPVIANVFQQLGFLVDLNALAQPVLEKDADLRYAVDTLQKRFDSELKRMNQKAKDVRKGRYSLGDEVANLPAGDGVDALLFVRVRGRVLTGNKKAFSFLVPGGGVFDMTFMQLGIVDAKTGEVLYFARPVVLKNISDDAEKASRAIRKSLKNIDKANSAGGQASPEKK